MNIYRKRDNNVKLLGFSSYAEYLESDLWKKIRKKFLKRRTKCRICRQQAQMLHHASYTLKCLSGETAQGHLTPLCKSCFGRVKVRKDGTIRGPGEVNVLISKLRKAFSKKFF